MRLAIASRWGRTCGAALGLAAALYVAVGTAAPVAEAQAQPPPGRFAIKLKTREFTPSPGHEVAAVRAQRGGRPDERMHFLLQFTDLPDAGASQRVASAGIDLV